VSEGWSKSEHGGTGGCFIVLLSALFLSRPGTKTTPLNEVGVDQDNFVRTIQLFDTRPIDLWSLGLNEFEKYQNELLINYL